MTIEIKKNVDELVLEITGRVDTITAPALDKTINENLEGLKTLILDLKETWVRSLGWENPLEKGKATTTVF